jgi:DNA polymerase-3 subunit epsilon
MELVLDFETTGLIPRNIKLSKATCLLFPRVVQAAWNFNGTTKYYYVKPVGFEIPQESINVHGITDEIAFKEGIGIKELLVMIMSDIHSCSCIVAHNAEYDYNILLSELYRLEQERQKQIEINTGDEIKFLDSMPVYCTMLNTIEWCAILHDSKYNKRKNGFMTKNYKWPKLSELYMKCTGKEIENAHDDRFDVIATVKCLERLKEEGLFTLNYHELQ